MKANIIKFCAYASIVVLAIIALLSHRDWVTNKAKLIYIALSRSFAEDTPEDQPHTEDDINTNQLNSTEIRMLLQQKYTESLQRESELQGNSNNPINQQMIETALDDLYYSKDPQDRELAVMTLGEYNTEDTLDGILFALDDPESIVRQQAVVQISKWTNNDERDNMLVNALKNDDPDIVVQALESIRGTDSRTLIDRLNQLSMDQNEQIRDAAKLALNMVED